MGPRAGKGCVAGSGRGGGGFMEPLAEPGSLGPGEEQRAP